MSMDSSPFPIIFQFRLMPTTASADIDLIRDDKHQKTKCILLICIKF